jgi:hypothetical protein
MKLKVCSSAHAVSSSPVPVEGIVIQKNKNWIATLLTLLTMTILGQHGLPLITFIQPS